MLIKGQFSFNENCCHENNDNIILIAKIAKSIKFMILSIILAISVI